MSDRIVSSLQKTPFSKLSGKRVILLCDIETRGGAKFVKGTEMVIVQKYHGLSLATPENPERRAVCRVGYHEVMIVPMKDAN